MKKTICTAMACVTVTLVLSTPALANVVSDWNDIMLALFSGQNPFEEGRIATITQLAVFEAVNAVTGVYRPYLAAGPAQREASGDAAAISAAHAVLKHFLRDKDAILDAARTKSLAAIPEGHPKAAGVAIGEAAAAMIISNRNGDGWEPPQFYLPHSSNAGDWQLTPGCPPQGGVLFQVPAMKPFGIRSPRQFRSDPPPLLISSHYTRDYREVKEVGGAGSTERPTDRADVARFYDVVSPILWANPVAKRLAAAQNKSLVDTARALALVNVAIFDGLIASFDSKYHYILWRPETAILGADTDPNAKTIADPAFMPFITTPCFPSYPSAHATGSYAVREVLEEIYGEGPHAITLSHPAVPGVTLAYTRLRQITDDIDDARVYGGIHFRFDQKAGAEQGRRLGAYLSQHLLTPM